MFPIAPIVSGSNPFDARRQESEVEIVVDHLRDRSYKVSVAFAITAGLHCVTFWATYGWAILLIGFTGALSWLGLVHFSTMVTLEASQCALAPLSAVSYFGNGSIVIIIGGCLSILTSILAVMAYQQAGSSAWLVAFATISLINSCAYVVAGILGVRWGKQLYTACLMLEVMCPPHWVAQPIEARAVEGTVITSAPMYPRRPQSQGRDGGEDGAAASAPMASHPAAFGPPAAPPQPTYGGSYYGSPAGYNGAPAYASGYPARSPDQGKSPAAAAVSAV